jgi:hypothetical protein
LYFALKEVLAKVSGSSAALASNLLKKVNRTTQYESRRAEDVLLSTRPGKHPTLPAKIQSWGTWPFTGQPEAPHSCTGSQVIALPSEIAGH